MRRESRPPLLSLERGLSLPLGGSEAEVGRSLGSPLLCGGRGGGDGQHVSYVASSSA